MSVLSVLFFLGFALLVMLGLVAVGLVFAASFFALVAAGADVARVCSRIYRVFLRVSDRLGSTGRQFVGCWIGVGLSCALVLVNLIIPRVTGAAVPLRAIDILGIALCIPAASQLTDRILCRRGRHH